MKQKQEYLWKLWSVLSLVLIALAVIGLRVFWHPEPHFKGVYWNAPSFSYEERSGRTVQSSELQGHYWVADFIFTRCAGSCPVMSEQMSRLQTEWKGDPRLQLVTFTVDPQYDTAAVLRDYADDLHADPHQWLFLTGDKKNLLKTATEGFKLDALENPNGTPGAQFIHSTYLVLVGPNGKILDFYDGTDETEFKQLRVDLKTLLGERKIS